MHSNPKYPALNTSPIMLAMELYTNYLSTLDFLTVRRDEYSTYFIWLLRERDEWLYIKHVFMCLIHSKKKNQEKLVNIHSYLK